MIMGINENKPIPLVSISCITYNHAPYIRQCLDGFMMQKTNFVFEVLIHDDASTDGTTEIIKEYEKKYPDIIKPIYEKENQWVKGRRGSAVFNIPRAKGKYIALCEGDDCWIEPCKLQKQVDVMEKDTSCSLVISNGIISYLKQGKESIINPLGDIESQYVGIDSLLKEGGGLIPTASMMCKKDLYMNMPNFFKEAPVGDRPLRMWLAINGRVYYMSEPTIMYRAGTVGSFGERTSNNYEYAKFIYEKMEVFFNKYNEYTNGKYDSLISYMKDREKYLFCLRTRNMLLSFKTDYFKSKPLFVRIKQYIKYIINIFYKI